MMLYESLHFQVSDHFDHASDRLTERRTSAPLTAFPKLKNPKEFGRTNSYVVGQKLRESKWLEHDEMKIFCAVVETGFIVERKTDEEESKIFGVVLWDSGFEKSKDPERISIYSLKDCKGLLKVHKFTLLEFWPSDTSIRINNHSDRNETPHPEDTIRKHIAHAEKRKMKWHNSEHFTYWCRYAQVDLARIKHLKPAWNKLSEGSNDESKANYYGWKEKMRRYIYGKGNVDDCLMQYNINKVDYCLTDLLIINKFQYIDQNTQNITI